MTTDEMQLKREIQVKKIVRKRQNNYTNCVEVDGWASSKGAQGQVFDLGLIRVSEQLTPIFRDRVKIIDYYT